MKKMFIIFYITFLFCGCRVEKKDVEFVKLNLIDSYLVNSGFVNIIDNSNTIAMESVENLPDNQYLSKTIDFVENKFKPLKSKTTDENIYKNISKMAISKYDQAVNATINLSMNSDFSLLREINLDVFGKAKIYIKPVQEHQFITRLELVQDRFYKAAEFEYGFIDSIKAKKINNSIIYFVTVVYCGASSCSTSINAFN